MRRTPLLTYVAIVVKMYIVYKKCSQYLTIEVKANIKIKLYKIDMSTMIINLTFKKLLYIYLLEFKEISIGLIKIKLSKMYY